MVGTEQSICRSAGSVSSGAYGWDRAMKPKNRRGGGMAEAGYGPYRIVGGKISKQWLHDMYRMQFSKGF